MANSREVQRYLETDIQSIAAEKLLVLLYEKMADDLLEARRAIPAGDRVRMADRITHSQQIIAELRSALDHSVGGEISLNLESLYDYLFLEHLEVLVDQDPRHIDNCLAVLTPLLAAWRQIPAGTAEECGRSRTLQSVSA
jgi:flagellar protein FliS